MSLYEKKQRHTGRVSCGDAEIYRHRHEDMWRWRQIGVLLPQVMECLRLPGARRGKGGLSPRGSGGAQPCQFLDF